MDMKTALRELQKSCATYADAAGRISDRLDTIVNQNATIISMLGDISMAQTTSAQALATLTASFNALKSVDDAAVTLLGQLADLIRNNVTDPAALLALAAQIDAETARMKAAETSASAVLPH